MRDSISRSYEKRSNVTIFNIIFSLVFLSSSFRCISKATITRGAGRIFDCLKIRAFINRCSVHTEPPYRDGSRGRVQGVRTPPPSRDKLRLSNTTGILQDMAGDMYDLYSQQFTLCYWLVKSLLLRIRFYNLFTSAVSYEISLVSGAPPPKKNHGSAPALTERKFRRLALIYKF